MRFIPALLVLLLATAPALAQSSLPSNIGLAQYPAPKCAAPPVVDPAMKPAAPPSNPTETEAMLYNSRIRTYNAAMRAHNEGVKTYAECVQAYIAAGKADMQRIQAAVDAAVAVANGQ